MKICASLKIGQLSPAFSETNLRALAELRVALRCFEMGSPESRSPERTIQRDMKKERVFEFSFLSGQFILLDVLGFVFHTWVCSTSWTGGS